MICKLRLFALVLLTLEFPILGHAQKTPPASATDAKPPVVVARFIQTVGDHPSAEQFFKQMKDSVWEVYPADESLKKELLEYVKSGPDGPGLAFAAHGLIPFHDPSTIEVILARAIHPKTSQATRWNLLNVTPYILAIGDAWCCEEGKLDKESKQFAAALSEEAKIANAMGLGRFHALVLHQIYSSPQKEKDANPDYGLVVWHQSAYVIGTLDLRDLPILAPLLNPEEGVVFTNILEALCYASNHDFAATLRRITSAELTPKAAKNASAKALAWWQAYLQEHPDGSWLPASISGFRELGYLVEDDLKSSKSTQELLRAMDSPNSVLQYNVYRVLNYAYGTHFDLESAFHAGKYALSPFDPSSEQDVIRRKLKEYWQNRLKGTS